MSEAPPALRLVALGASNLVLGLPHLVAAVRGAVAGPIEVFAACGHGRSFGLWSRCLAIRALPGLRDCGLWQALAERPPLPTVALITDVGNDVAYGASSREIDGWLADCADRLASLEARVAMTLPPVAVLEALPAWRFALARFLLFPGRRIEQAAVNRDMRGVSAGLEKLAAQRGAAAIALEPSWFGLDPIHWRRTGRRAILDACLATWGLDTDQTVRDPDLAIRFALRTAFAAETRWLGRTVRVRQPVRRLADGSRVWLF